MRLEPGRGKNPKKENSDDGTALATMAASAAQAPGTGTMRRSAAAAAATSWKPGSEMQGVPASLISATDLPSCREDSRPGSRSRQLCSWQDRRCWSGGRRRFEAWRRRPATRVSSAAIIEAVDRIDAARGVRSDTLPMGVDTI